jgi:hypothetical protein
MIDSSRTWLLESESTGADSIEFPTPHSETMPALSSISENAGFLRSCTKSMHEGVEDFHRATLLAEWRDRTNSRARSSVSEMLTDIADLGFAWRDMARLIGVSVPAIQKWRRTSGCTGEHRRRIGALLAACEMITENGFVQDIASWMDMPLDDGIPVTPMDIWSSGEFGLVLDLASGHVETTDVLDVYNPDWRESYRSDFEVIKAGDGNLSIRLKER